MAIQQSPFVAGSEPQNNSAELTRLQFDREEAEKRAERLRREEANRQKLLDLKAAMEDAGGDLNKRYTAELELWQEQCRQGMSPGPKPLPPIVDPLIANKGIGTVLSDGRLVLRLDLQAEIDGEVKLVRLRFSHEDLMRIRAVVEKIDLENLTSGYCHSEPMRQR